METYILMDEDGETTITNECPKANYFCWPKVVQVSVSCGDYGIIVKEMDKNGEWHEIHTETT